MMLENAKRKIAAAMNMVPNRPTSLSRAACVRAIPLRSPEACVPLKRITNAVQLQTTSVSTNTPSACISPCFTGCDTSAVAATFGAEPSPASLEKSPLLIPIIMVAPMPPPATCAKPNASLTIRENTCGTISICLSTINRASAR